MHLWAGNVAGAERHLALAARLESLPADARDLGAFHSCQALAHARRREAERAGRLIERAREELADAPAEQGLLWLAQGLTEATRDDLDAAGRSFQRAIDALAASSMHREAAAVCQEWSQLLTDAGRNEEAAETAKRAARLDENADVKVAGQGR